MNCLWVLLPKCVSQNESNILEHSLVLSGDFRRASKKTSRKPITETHCLQSVEKHKAHSSLCPSLLLLFTLLLAVSLSPPVGAKLSVVISLSMRREYGPSCNCLFVVNEKRM